MERPFLQNPLPKFQQHLRISVTTHPQWNNGFVFYTGDSAILFGGEPFTSWKWLDDAA